MSTGSSPMVPGTRWDDAAKAFDKASPQQALLCVPCYAMGITTHAKFVVDGNSLCLHHLNGKWHAHE